MLVHICAQLLARLCRNVHKHLSCGELLWTILYIRTCELVHKCAQTILHVVQICAHLCIHLWTLVHNHYASGAVFCTCVHILVYICAQACGQVRNAVMFIQVCTYLCTSMIDVGQCCARYVALLTAPLDECWCTYVRISTIVSTTVHTCTQTLTRLSNIVHNCTHIRA